MGQTLLWIERLPEGALDAATLFHSRDLPLAREALRDTDAIALIFAAAPFNHRGWRLSHLRLGCGCRRDEHHSEEGHKWR